MSRKTLKPLVTGAAVLAVLIVAALAVFFWPDAEDPGQESPSPAVSVLPTKYFIKEEFNSFTRIDVKPRDVESFSIVSTGEGAARSFSVEPAAEGWGYKQDTLRSGAYNASAIIALSQITDNAGAAELEQYGLTDPICEYTVEFYDTAKGRRSYSFEIGDMLAIGDSYYARLKGESAVFAISAYAVSTFSSGEISYREFNFFPQYDLTSETGADTDGSIVYTRVVDPTAGVDIEIKFDQNATEDNSFSAYKMLKPVEAYCLDETDVDKLHNIAVLLKVDAVVTDDPTPEQLSQYGFDNPRELWLEDVDGNSVHYILGFFNSSGSGYVMVEGCPSLMTASGLDASIFQRPYLEYMFKMLVTVNIADVSGVAYTLPGGDRHLMSITEYSSNDSNGTKIKGLWDGRELSQTNISRLYARTLSMTVDGELDTPHDTSGNADILITINKHSGEKNTIELYMLNERRYAVSVDGGDAVYYVNASAVKTMLAGIDYIERGEEIPRV